MNETFTKNMTLRDYFAAKAMQAYFSDPALIWDDEAIIATGAEYAYEVADAMMEARSR
ncbi:hypothetical protein [Flavobacterium sp.]|jgi:hypothetical protein|uniref:hypothetical protein n=1 Tax=Flavobacterium sp. TaxID=239 RepID=UPI0037BE7629